MQLLSFSIEIIVENSNRNDGNVIMEMDKNIDIKN